MLSASLIVVYSLLYLGLLFAIAYWADRRADAGRSVIGSPTVYALSLAVYCTAWTYYGSVGRAAASGVGFLPIYLGPTLIAALWWPLLSQDDAHQQEPTASPRSPISSPRATARASCSAAW